MSSKLPFIDTNVFLRFLIFDTTNPTLSQKSRRIIRRIQSGKLTVQTDVLIVSELVYVLEGYYGLAKTETVSKLEPLINLTDIKLPDKELIIAAFSVYVDKNLDFEDAYIYMQMLKQGVDKIYTFDTTHFKRLKDITILS